MEVFIEKDKSTRKIRFSGTVSALLHRLKINPEEVLVIKGEEIILEDEKLKDSDSIKVLSVISGG